MSSSVALSAREARLLFPLLLALGLLALACAPDLVDMVTRWLDAEGHYGHGPLVPLCSAWLAWRARGQLIGAAGAPDAVWSRPLGLLLVTLAALVVVVGRLEDVAALVNGAAVLALFGLSLALLGLPRTRVLAFPLGFLFFAVPLPPAVLDAATFQLKLLATWLTVGVLEVAQVPVVTEGGTLHLAGVTVTVADACSGLKTALSLTAMAALFAHLQATRARAALTLALALPIAVVANVARVLALCGLVAWWGPDVLEGPLHDGSGLVVYAVALGALLAVHAPADDDHDHDHDDVAVAVAGGASRVAPRAAGAEPEVLPSPACQALSVAPLALAAVLSLTLSLAAALAPAPDPSELATARLPLDAGGWTGTLLPLGDEVFGILGTRDARMQRHTRPGLGGEVDLYVTHSAGDVFRVAHPPARCFEGGGYLELQRAVVDLPVGERHVPVNRLVFRRGEEVVLVYTWYRVDGRDVPSYLDYRLASFLRRLRPYRSGGSMVRLSTVVGAAGVDDLDAADARVRALGAEALPALLAPL